MALMHMESVGDPSDVYSLVAERSQQGHAAYFLEVDVSSRYVWTFGASGGVQEPSLSQQEIAFEVSLMS